MRRGLRAAYRASSKRDIVSTPSLPRLIFIADIPVEATYHGSALMYRLLQDYPRHGLLIVEQSQTVSIPERRLPDVRYEQIHFPLGRLLRTRFAEIATSGLLLAAPHRDRQIKEILHGFEPQAVLTVAHGFSWLAAHSFARKNRLPLHLVVHDDCPRTTRVVGLFRSWIDRRFGEVYQKAASRLCVSPYMADEYEGRYGVKGSVLYPSRSRDTPTFGPISMSDRARSRPFTVAFAGSLNTPDFIRQLAILSNILGECHGRLLLFGPFDGAVLADRGASTTNIVFGGLVRSEELVRRLRAEADVLFLPTSFAKDEAGAFAINFPSKLTDYTAAGMPILVWGPEDSSAAKWVLNEPGVAVLVTDRTGTGIAQILERLAHDCGWRHSLAKAAADAGKRYFSPIQAQSDFYAALSSTISRDP